MNDNPRYVNLADVLELVESLRKEYEPYRQVAFVKALRAALEGLPTRTDRKPCRVCGNPSAACEVPGACL